MPSGMVFTVNGAARALMYRMSEALGSLVPVLAHSRRCGRAPALKTRCQRGELEQRAVGLVRPLRHRDAELVAQRRRHLVHDGGVPAADEHRGDRADLGLEPGRRCAARCHAGMPRPPPGSARGENSRVTLIGTPAKIASSMAGSPSLVPGILMNRFGRPARACSSLAAARVLAVSWASSGDTSSDTQPSTPSVRSQIGRNRSAARVRSSSASSKNSASPDLPSLSFWRMAAS